MKTVICLAHNSFAIKVYAHAWNHCILPFPSPSFPLGRNLLPLCRPLHFHRLVPGDVPPISTCFRNHRDFTPIHRESTHLQLRPSQHHNWTQVHRRRWESPTSGQCFKFCPCELLLILYNYYELLDHIRLHMLAIMLTCISLGATHFSLLPAGLNAYHTNHVAQSI